VLAHTGIAPFTFVGLSYLEVLSKVGGAEQRNRRLLQANPCSMKELIILTRASLATDPGRTTQMA